MSDALPFVPAAVSIGSSLFGGGGAGSSTPSAPNLSTFQYPNMPEFATDFQTLLNQNIANNPAAANAGNAQNIYTQLTNPTYANTLQTNANTAGTDAASLAALNMGNANSLSTQGGNLISGANNVMNLGMDPQQALYNRTLQQLQDQIRVGQSSRGITMSPYGANLENEALGNFNIDWQNNQLSRAISGLNAATPASTAASGLFTNAANVGGQGVTDQAAAGALPYSANQTIGTANQGALTSLINTLTGANNTNQMSLSDILSYLGGGSGQANANANLTGTNYQNQLNQAQTSGAGLSSLFGSLGNALTSFGGSSNGLSSGSNFSPSDIQAISAMFDAGSSGFGG